MRKRSGFFKPAIFSLATLVSSLGLSGECYIPGSNTYWPDARDLDTVGIPHDNTSISEEEAFADQTDTIVSSQSGFVSSVEPDMVSAMSHFSILRVADSNSQFGLCSTLVQFPGLEKYQTLTVTGANLVLCLNSDAENQSQRNLNVEIGSMISPWSASSLSYKSLSSMNYEGGTTFEIFNNYPGTPVKLNLKRVTLYQSSSGSITDIVQNWINNPSQNNGLIITRSFEYQTSGQFRAFKKLPDEKPYLEIMYKRNSKL
jgi:hypothetical protein